MLLIAVVLCAGCRQPEPAAYPLPSVYVPSAPAPVPASTSLPSTRSTNACALVTEIAELKPFYGYLPTGSEDVIYNAALQFMTSVGQTIESQDPIAHTIVARRTDGQTLLSTCEINRYFMYAIHIAVVGKHVIVSMQCWTSLGWEGGNGTPRNRGELKACDVPTYVSKNDAKLPAMIFEGSVATLDLRTAPAAGGRTHWWCYGGDVTCFRERSECESKPRKEATRCEPRQRAYCWATDPSVCFGSSNMCTFNGNNSDRNCVYAE